MQYPATVKLLAEEIKKACSDYYSKKLNNDEIKEVVLYYAENHSDKMFDGEVLNPTVSKIIGKKRAYLVTAIVGEGR